jgi:hypothetical protein
MQKIRCPHCGVINLEKFITYPQCAACGRALPQVSPESSPPFWKRPVPPIFWALSVGLLLAGLLWTASVFRVDGESRSQVVLYGDRHRQARIGQMVTFHLRVDALGETRSEHRRPLRKVRLRIPLRNFETVRFVSLQPPPDTMTIVGRGRFFTYTTLSHDSSLQLRLRVVKPTLAPLSLSVYADDHMPGFWRVYVKTTAIRN